MNSFTALDFETATGYRNSICQVGLVRVANGIITQEINVLVQPPDNYYWSRFTTYTELLPKTLQIRQLSIKFGSKSFLL
jgi:DNA polymerase-3 subunit epsilon